MASRIQRKRAKGWKMPEGAVYVGRPTIWGKTMAKPNYPSAEEMRTGAKAALDRKITAGMPISQAGDEVIAEFRQWAARQPKMKVDWESRWLQCQLGAVRGSVWLRLQMWRAVRAWIGMVNSWHPIIPACRYREADSACVRLNAYLNQTSMR